MKIAIALHDNKVSTVFDFARSALISDHGEGNETVELPMNNDCGRVSKLVENGVDVLICGAVSKCLASMIMAAGIELVPFVSGDAEQVLSAYKNGRLGEGEFLQPGCGRGERRGFCGG